MTLLFSLRNTRGQTLLITAMLITVLMIVSIPIVIYFHQISTRTLVITQQRDKADMAIREGAALASRLVSSTTTWKALLDNHCPQEFNDALGHPIRFRSPGSADYTIECGTPLRPFAGQVKLIVTAYGSGAEDGVLRTANVILGRRTLAQSSAVTAIPVMQAAVSLFHVPISSGNFQVHWGPLLCYDNNPWTVSGEMDRLRYPRKFSQGTILRQESTKPDSGRDVFSSVSLGFAPVIDERSYKEAAEKSVDVVPPFSRNKPDKTQSANPAGSGYFYMEDDTAVFRSFSTEYRAPPASATYYIDGNAQFQDVLLDIKEGHGLLVKGNLTLLPRNTAGATLSVAVPEKAAREYPEEPMRSQFPCHQEVGRLCSARMPVHFQGFVYVQGDLILEPPKFGQIANWVFAGALRVDGRLLIPEGAGLTVYYNDAIGNRIRVTGSTVDILSIE